MSENLKKMKNEELRYLAYKLGIALDANETQGDLIAKITVAQARQEDIRKAVAVVIEVSVRADYGEEGYPLLGVVAGLMGNGEGLTEEEVRAAADAVWAEKEDAATGDTEGTDGDASQGGDEGGKEAAASTLLPKDMLGPRAEVIAATKDILKLKEPLERGAPALWALRDQTGFDGSGDDPAVSKAEAAAAFEAVTGEPWPWPPTAQQLKREHAARELRFPAAMYKTGADSITVEDEAKEAAAKKNGYKRPEDMKPAVFQECWEREAEISRAGSGARAG